MADRLVEGRKQIPRLRVRRALYLALGLVLLGAVVSATDLSSVWRQLSAFGALGLLVIVALYFVEFAADVLAWQTALVGMPLQARWLRRLYLVRLVGEAFNTVTPMGGMGGEPVKAVLLRKYYSVPYRESGPSLVLAKTNSLIALVVFLSGGFALLLLDERFPPPYKVVAGCGLAALAVAIVAFFLVQRLRVTSRLGGRLGRWRYTRRLLEVLHHVEDFDERLARFYSQQRRRFIAAIGLGLFNWSLGAIGVYATFVFLGVPVSLLDAWVIESISQLVRAGTFFIPAGIGAHEGVLVIVLATLRGDPSAGLAAALVRRARELLWITMGLLIGWQYSFRPPVGVVRRGHA